MNTISRGRIENRIYQVVNEVLKADCNYLEGGKIIYTKKDNEKINNLVMILGLMPNYAIVQFTIKIPKIPKLEKSKVEKPKILYYVDGKEESIEFERNTSKRKITISGVSGTSITGDIDITDGKNSLKGSFSANGHKSVK